MVRAVPDDDRRTIATRLRRVAGQVNGVARMVEGREDCEKILTQIMAARAALERAAGQVVAAHVDECLETRPREEAAALITRIVGLLARTT